MCALLRRARIFRQVVYDEARLFVVQVLMGSGWMEKRHR